MTRVVIEGPDGVGKSTLARQLGVKLGSIVVNCGPGPKTNDELQKHLNNQEAILQVCNPVVMDRCTAVSHRVYSAIGEYLSDYDNALLSGYLNNMRAMDIRFVLCKTARPSHVVKDYDDPILLENIWRNYDTLVRLYDETLYDAIRFDFTTDTIDSLVEKLK